MATTTIEVNGEPVDVSACAQRNCGNHPMTDPKFRGVIGGGIFSIGSKARDAATKEEYKKALAAWNTCLQKNCHPETGQEGSATKTGEPISKPVVENAPVGTDTRTQSPAPRPAAPPEEEGWLKRNQTWIIVGGIAIALTAGGILTYRALK